MKRLLATALAAAATFAAPIAHAFPDKLVTIVVPTAPGGGNDAMARIIAQKLGPLLGQTVVVDNKAGANGAIAAEYVARALTATQLKALAAKLKEREGKDVKIKTTVDPEVLGGLVVRIGSTQIDSSIRTRLNSLAQAMKG